MRRRFALGQIFFSTTLLCILSYHLYCISTCQLFCIIIFWLHSASHSEIGSDFIVNHIVDIFKNKFPTTDFETFIETDKQEIDAFFINSFKELYGQLKELAKERDLPIKSLASTLIVVLFSKSGLICSHIGDGRAGFQDMDNNWFPILEPYKGEEANQTIFITSDIWEKPQEFIRTTVIRQPVQSFTLMSDGCENATF